MNTFEEPEPSPSANLQDTRTDSLIERLVSAKEIHERPLRFGSEFFLQFRLRRKAARDIAKLIPMLQTSRQDDKDTGLVLTAEQLKTSQEPTLTMVPSPKDTEVNQDTRIDDDQVVVPFIAPETTEPTFVEQSAQVPVSAS